MSTVFFSVTNFILFSNPNYSVRYSLSPKATPFRLVRSPIRRLAIPLCSKSSEAEEVSAAPEDEWLKRLPDKKKPLYSHSLPCIEAWLRSLGFFQSREDRAVWLIEKPEWHAQLSLDVTDLYVRYLKTGPGNLEKDMERRFSYALSREDIENAVLGGGGGKDTRSDLQEFAAPKSGFRRFSLLSWNTFTVRLPSVHLQVSNLREPSPDLKMGSMSRLKGTTLVAFFFERFNGKEIVTGIMIGADSRLSNKKRFLNIGKKIFRIGKNILILMAGNGDDCEKMCAHLTGKLNNPVEVGSLKVGDVLDMVVTYLNANLDVDGDNSNIGSLVVGWDEKEGLLVYRTKLKDQWVHWEGEHNLYL
ncbi:hypothetical protein ACLB2K_070991 [Fragaria x ananassa]